MGATYGRFQSVKIWSIPHTLFQAKCLVIQLEKIGVNAKIVDTISPLDNDLYILIGGQSVPVIPKYYIVWQTEIKNSHHFNTKYLKLLSNALAVWEYNEENIGAYKNSNISIIEPCVIQQPKIKKDIDYLFYGWIDGSERRLKKVMEIQRHLPLTVITNSLGQQMFDILARTKVVINIHYYSHSPLELFRISEAMSYGCNVVSEGSGNKWSDVYFCNTIEEMVSKAKDLKNKLSNYDLSKYDNIEEIKKSLYTL